MPLSSPIGRPPVELERVVRPLVQSPIKADRVNAFAWGGTGNNTTGETVDTEGTSIPTLSWSADASVQVTTLAGVGFSALQDSYEETKRETHVNRVFSDTDPDTYVDVEVIDKVAFEDGIGRPVRYSFNNPS